MMQIYEKDGVIPKLFGPYTNRENRKFVILWYSSKDKKTKSYARYLVEIHLGRLLSDNETVDHKDEDKTNDVLDNFQILTRKENNVKHIKLNDKQEKMFSGICPNCGIDFTRPMRYVKGNLKKGKSGPFCSRSCAGKYTYKNPWAVDGNWTT